VCARYDSNGNLRHICGYLCAPALIEHFSCTLDASDRSGSFAQWPAAMNGTMLGVDRCANEQTTSAVLNMLPIVL
jgi:hypothetical protein